MHHYTRSCVCCEICGALLIETAGDATITCWERAAEDLGSTGKHRSLPELLSSCNQSSQPKMLRAEAFVDSEHSANCQLLLSGPTGHHAPCTPTSKPNLLSHTAHSYSFPFLMLYILAACEPFTPTSEAANTGSALCARCLCTGQQAGLQGTCCHPAAACPAVIAPMTG